MSPAFRTRSHWRTLRSPKSFRALLKNSLIALHSSSWAKRSPIKSLTGLANRFGHALRSLGLAPGDRVALLLPNIPQIVIAYFGAWRARLVPVPINPLYTDHEIEHQLTTSGATALVSLDLLAPRMLALRERTDVKTVITAHIKDYLPFPAKQLFPFVKKGMTVDYRPAPDYHDFLELMKAAPRHPGRPPTRPRRPRTHPLFRRNHGPGQGCGHHPSKRLGHHPDRAGVVFRYQGKPRERAGDLPVLSHGRFYRGHEPLRHQRLDRRPHPEARAEDDHGHAPEIPVHHLPGGPDHLRGRAGAARSSRRPISPSSRASFPGPRRCPSIPSIPSRTRRAGPISSRDTA